MSETLFAGQPGPKGDKGEPGMSRGARRAVIFLFALTLALAALNLLFTARYVNSTVHSAQKATAAKAAAAVAAQEAATAEAGQTALCHAGNAARADQTGLWMFLIHLSKPPKTAGQRRLLAEFEHHLRVVFAPRSCALPRPR